MSANHSLKVCIESFNDEAGFVAWIDNQKFKGMVVQSSSIEGVLKELLISLKVKIAYEYGIGIEGIDEKVAKMIQEASTCKDGKQEINLNNLKLA